MAAPPTLALVMMGGALGAAARYWIGGAWARQLGDGIPYGTLAVNLAGSLAAGFLISWLDGRSAAGVQWRAFLLVGVLGAFTTYSALMVECLAMARTSRSGLMVGYLGATLVGGLVLVWVGARVGEVVRG